MEDQKKWLLIGATALVAGLLTYKFLTRCKCTDCKDCRDCKNCSIGKEACCKSTEAKPADKK